MSDGQKAAATSKASGGKCPYTSLKDTVTEDLTIPVVALTATGFAKRMGMENTYLGLSMAILGYSTFADVKNSASQKANSTSSNASNRLYLHLGVLTAATVAGLYAGGFFSSARASKKSA